MSDPFVLESALKIIEIASIVCGGGLVLFRMGRVTERFERLIAKQGDAAAQMGSTGTAAR
jgi:hypothetical protein